MKLFSLALHLPNNEVFSLEVDQEDTFLKVLQELFFFDMLEENDEHGTLILYHFIHKESSKELSLSATFGELFSEALNSIDILVQAELSADIDTSEGEETTQEEMISVALFVQPEGIDMDVELPTTITASQLLVELRELGGVLAESDNGHSSTYRVIRASDQTALPMDQSLKESGILGGEILNIVPEWTSEKPALPQEPEPPPIPQSVSNLPDSEANILFQFPEQLIIGQANPCIIRMANDHLLEYMSRRKLLASSDIQDRPLSEIFRLHLEEHAIESILEIHANEVKEDKIGEKEFMEWHFDLRPSTIGFTSLILQAELHLGAPTEVFALNHECEVIAQGQEPISSLWQEYESLSILFWWSEWLKDQILMGLSDQMIGKSLALLANFLQHQDESLYQSLILLQAQWNDGKTRTLNGLIPQASWEDIQARISHAVLELIADIESRNRLKPRRIRKHTRNLNKVKTVAEKVI